MIMNGFPDPEGLAVMRADLPAGPRPCHVYDYDGEHLGSFTSWSAAHEWAHLQAAMGGVLGPLEVEDRHAGEHRQVWVDRCADVGQAAAAQLCDVLDSATHIPAQTRRPG